MGEHGRSGVGQPGAMGGVSGFERRIEGWVFGWWTRRSAARREPLEVVSILRQVCDDNALIMRRGRVVTPNVFILEVSADSHQRLCCHREALELNLMMAVRAHAALRSYDFMGAVKVLLGPDPAPDAGRYRIRSYIAPSSAGSAQLSSGHHAPVAAVGPAPPRRRLRGCHPARAWTTSGQAPPAHVQYRWLRQCHPPGGANPGSARSTGGDGGTGAGCRNRLKEGAGGRSLPLGHLTQPHGSRVAEAARLMDARLSQAPASRIGGTGTAVGPAGVDRMGDRSDPDHRNTFTDVGAAEVEPALWKKTVTVTVDMDACQA
ncbi:FhaA domain-containing protein [Streptomyces niger]|uniref:FhaA domain-containing protein n=1 Tax=Streptomyces niger TaxID=66373 RepID=UPI000DA5FE5D